MRKFTFSLLTLLLLIASVPAQAQVINLTQVNKPYVQTFDSLDNSGTTGSTMPYGWSFFETGGNTDYGIDNGGNNAGNTYSYGSTGSSDRALGSIASNAVQSQFGAKIRNNTGSSLSAIKVEFYVEQWRLGATGRQDSSVFEVSINATSLNDPLGFWIAVPQLNLYSPVTTGSATLNGNDPANRVKVSSTISGFPISNGTTVMVRWRDINISGNDDGLAIDSVAITPLSASFKPTLSFIPTTVNVTEDGDSVMIGVKPSSFSAQPISVDVALDAANGTASSGGDFTFTNTTLNWNAGDTATQMVTVYINDDVVIEADETIMLMLSNYSSNVALMDSVATITVMDNDLTRPIYTIGSITTNDATGLSDSLNQDALVKGVVTSPDFRGGNGIQFTIADPTGGITVFASSVNFGYTPTMGDSVLVAGTVSHFNGLTQLVLSSAPDTIVVLSQGNPLPAVRMISMLDESTESDIVQVRRVRLLTPSQWTGTGSFNADATNGIDTFVIRVHNTTDILGMGAPTGWFHITGMGGQFDNSSPHFDGYQIFPRNRADIQMMASLEPIGLVNVTDANGESTRLGDTVFVQGIVTSPNLRSGGTTFTIEDATGAINIFNSNSDMGYTPVVGDSVRVYGTVDFFHGLTQITLNPSRLDDTIELVNTGNTVPAPTLVAIVNESLESHLITVENVMMTNPGQWTNTGTAFNVNVTNGVDTFDIRIVNAVNVYGMTPPTGKFHVTGVVGQFDPTSPHFDGYQVFPRFMTDIVDVPDEMHWSTIGNINNVNANGIADSLGQKVRVKGIVTSPNFNTTPDLMFSIEDATGSIFVSSNDETWGYTVVTGDSVEVIGTVTQFNGLQQIELADEGDTIIRHSAGNTLPQPLVTTALNENTEGDLITLERFWMTDKTQWKGDGTSFNVDITNGTSTFVMRIYSGTPLASQTVPVGDTFNITGIGGQFDNSDPFTSDYQIHPRTIADFEEVSTIGFAEVKHINLSIYPNPATQVITIQAQEPISRIRIVDLQGRVMKDILTNNATVQLNLMGFEKGMYILNVQTASGTAIQRIVKQ